MANITEFDLKKSFESGLEEGKKLTEAFYNENQKKNIQNLQDAKNDAYYYKLKSDGLMEKWKPTSPQTLVFIIGLGFAAGFIYSNIHDEVISVFEFVAYLGVCCLFYIGYNFLNFLSYATRLLLPLSPDKDEWEDYLHDH